MTYVSLLGFALLTLAAASSGAKFMPGPWYDTLNKPWYTPPDWLFPIAWTVLYTMIAVAGWRVWRAEGLGAAVAIWGIGLVLNALWSYFMFGLQRIDLALLDALGMLVSIVAFILLARQADTVAALLFLPYLVWVGFAAFLNFTILRLNS